MVENLRTKCVCEEQELTGRYGTIGRFGTFELPAEFLRYYPKENFLSGCEIANLQPFGCIVSVQFDTCDKRLWVQVNERYKNYDGYEGVN